MLKAIGFVRARPKRKITIIEPRPEDVPTVPKIIAPPGVLVPDFYIDSKTKIFGCYVQPWEDILVEELEAKMRVPAMKDISVDFWTKEYLGEFKLASGVTPPFQQHYYRKPRIQNAPSPRYEQKTLPIGGITIDSFAMDDAKSFWSEIETRILAQMSEEDRRQAGFGGLQFTIHKNRTPEGTCRPTTSEPPPPPPIFRPSPLPSLDCAARASVIPRLLADSVSRRPPSTDG